MHALNHLELAAGVLLLLIASAPLLWRLFRSRPLWSKALVAVIWCGAYFGIAWAYSSSLQETPDETKVTNRPAQVFTDGYVGSDTCQSCHPHHHETWHDSYHRTMTQVANQDSVLGNFDEVELEYAGEKWHLSGEGDRFFVQVPNESERREVVLTTGSHHMQMYWFDSGRERNMGQLPFIYLLDESLPENRRWIPREAAFLRPPVQGAWADEGGRWNSTCIKCHSTHGVWAPSGDLKEPQTHVADFGISCEACHGPGEEHVKRNQNPARRYRLHLSGQGDPTLVQPEDLNASLSSQVCGQCHGTLAPLSEENYYHWQAHGFRFRPGGELSDSRFLLRRKQETRPKVVQDIVDDDPFYLNNYFWGDGMVRVSGREYTGLVESACHQRGELSCISCHTLHQKRSDSRPRKEWANDQLSPSALGDSACTQCHTEYKTDEQIAAHTHHPINSSGSSCYNCHMPHTTYGLLKAIRSHTITSPSVVESLPTGADRPNACNLCHLDKTLAWSAGHLEKWFDQPAPPLDEEHRTRAASLSWLLKGDAAQRALLSWHMGWGSAREVSGDAWIAPHLARLLNDPYDAVRFIAHRSLKSLPGSTNAVREFDFMAPKLDRQAFVDKFIRGWTTDQEWPPELLILPDGTPDAQAIRELQFDRDDTPVYLAE